MDLSKINEALRNFDQFRYSNTPVESKRSTDSEEGHEIYKIGDDYVKIIIQEDSYGGNEIISGIAFVKPREVSTTNFETL